MQQIDFTNKIEKEKYIKDPFDFVKEDLLGAYLCTVVDGVLTAGKITEVEVYLGAKDRACHAYQYHKTSRNAVMFEQGGVAYVYFVYGMYHQMNVVMSPKGEPNAILIRALEPVEGIEIMKQRRQSALLNKLTTGPGKLCQAMGINIKMHNGADLTGNQIWITPRLEKPKMKSAKRVGIDYAGQDKDRLWRFYIKDNVFISKK